MLADGHSSWFSHDVQRFNHEKEMTSHVSPRRSMTRSMLLFTLCAMRNVITFLGTIISIRKFLCKFLVKIWSQWTSKEAIVKAFQGVGISTSELSIEWMQDDKFAAAEAIIHKEPATPIQKERFEMLTHQRV